MLPALIAAVLVLALLACITLYRRRPRGAPRGQTLAAQTLEQLEQARSLMHPASGRAFCGATSEVIRTYIERRFDVLATQRTTEEFLQSLLQSRDDALVRHRALLEQFLGQCDLVKFAPASPAPADLTSLLQSARQFVLQTADSAPVS